MAVKELFDLATSDRGLAVCIVLTLLGLAVKYGPALINAHINFVDTTSKMNVENADNTARIATALETLAANEEQHTRTHEALAHFARAAKRATTNADAHEALDEALSTLRRATSGNN